VQKMYLGDGAYAEVPDSGGFKLVLTTHDKAFGSDTISLGPTAAYELSRLMNRHSLDIPPRSTRRKTSRANREPHAS